MRKNLLLLLLMSFLWLFQLQAAPIPKGNAEHARKIRCLVVTTTGHFDLMHPQSLRDIMEEFGGVEYSHTPKNLQSLTAEEMLEYDVVWVYNFTPWEDVGITGEKMSTLLADYVKKGGYLMESLHIQEMDAVAKLGLLSGPYITENLSPFKTATLLAAGSSNMGKVTHPEHPIMDQVHAINTTAVIYGNEAREDATTLAYYEETGAPLVSVYKNIVALNISPVDLHLTTGVGTFVYGDGHRLFYNAIKWLFSNKYDITAPDNVSKLLAKPAPNGNAFDIALEWTNPSYTIDGNDLSTFTAIRIYRDNVLVKTLENPTKGAALSWVDASVTAGSHIYKVVGVSGEKEGYPTSVKTYSGKDVPASVYNITLAPKGNGGYLTWENDVYGKNNGWIDAATLTFKIVRQPGNVTVAEKHTSKSFTDNTITEKSRYYYEITPSTVDGAGAKERSGEMYLYTNGDIYMGTSKIVTCSGKFYGPEGPDSNYRDKTAYVLCMAPENPENGKRVQVSFKKMDINFQVGSSDELYIFDGPNLDAPQIPGSPFAGQQVPAILTKLQAGAKNTSGTLTFGFITSEQGVGKGWEADISCVQLVDKDLTVASVKGDVLPLLGKPYTYKVIVKNEGLQAQDNFKVKFFAKTPTNFVDSITVNRSLASGDTMHFNFTWTPADAGQNPLGALVILENDGNTENNQSKPYMTTVQSATTVTSSIRGNFELQTMFVPWCFFEKTSVTQSIYLKDQINLAKGQITAVRYFNTFLNEIPNERVILHIMETPKTDLSGGWVPEASMKKIFDGVITFPFGENDITLVLDSPFDYKGGNLVIRAEHPKSPYNYTIADAFRVNFDEKNAFRSLRWSGDMTETFNEKTAEIKNLNYYPCILFAVDVKDAASIKGLITSKGLPVDSVFIKVKDTPYTAMSNAKGEYILPSLSAGTYTLECSKFSYVTQEASGVSATEGNATVKDIEINEIPRAFVAGKVIDNEGLAIEGARVELNGYDNYSTTTLNDGTFKIERIYTDKKYEIKVTKDRFIAHKDTFKFGEKDTTLNAITIVQITYPPLSVKAEQKEVEKSVELTWKDPADMNFTRIVYDNGEASTAYGAKPEVDGWFGTVFTVKDSGFLESIDLYGVPHPTFEEGELGHRPVRIDIFNAQRKKVDSSETFLIPSEGWINIPMNFFEYKGPFYAMVHFIKTESATNYNNLLGGDMYGPNANKQTNYFSDGFAWGVVQSMAVVDPFAFLIRANVFTDNKKQQLQPGSVEEPTYQKGKTFTPEQGKAIAENVIESLTVKGAKISAATAIDNSNPFKKAYKAKYMVYRFPENKREHVSEWTLLTTTANTPDKRYEDNSFNTLAQGSYYYAVKANYTADLVSVSMLSNLVHKDMFTTINLQGQTNTANNEIEGAEVRLVNVDKNETHIYTGTFDADGKLSITNVWKGQYNIMISKLGFLTLDTTAAFNTEVSYNFNVKLIQDKRAPYNLKMTPKDETKPGTYTFTWNESKNLEEGFESHTDFTVNSPGKIGWEYLDGDKSLTYAVQGIEFPHQGERMAYIVFNPFQTTPQLSTLEGLPFKGKKYLAGFAAGEGRPNDDWLISPKLSYTNEFTFSFNARSFSSSDGLEKIQVGYSTNTSASTDFVWIQGGQSLSLPTKWSEYSYTIPGAAKYVAIRSVGFETYMLMIDEIFIGNEKTGESTIKGFKVYLDGVELAQTQTKEYTFTNIADPNNQKAGVRAIYESGESEISEIGFVYVGIEEDVFANSLRVYPNPAQNYIILDGLTQNATYEIYNIYGSMVKTNTSTKNIEQISISDLSSGSYVIRIISNQGTALKRFIKK